MSEEPLQVEQKNIQDNKKQMLRGSFWLVAGSIMSRIIGALYIIPWAAMFGEMQYQGNALFSKGYNLYALALMAATAGVPSAVSKLVARYNAEGEYNLALKLYRTSLVIGLITGVIAAGGIWIFAPELSGGDPNVIPVLHSLAPAILIIPILSMTRGFFQGNNQMASSSFSQFIEQVLRVIYMLFMTWFILSVNHGKWQDAVVQSTFAAFVGALGGIAVLVWVLYRQRTYFHDLSLQSKNETTISNKRIFAQVIFQAIPFVVVGSAIPIFQIIDQYSYFDIMQRFTNFTYAELNSQYAIFDFNANKLIMIVISLAVAMGSTAIPLLAAAHTRNDKKEIASQIRFTLELFVVVMIPAAIGMAAIARPLYITFYGFGNTTIATMGTLILQFSSYLGILFGLFTILSTVTQGLSNNALALKSLAIGIIIKLILQVPATASFGAMGPLVASFVGFGVASIVILHKLKSTYEINYKAMMPMVIYVIISAIIMGLIASIMVSGLGIFLPSTGRLTQFIIAMLGMIFGGGVYTYLILKSKFAEQLFGQRIVRLKRKLKIK